MERPKTYRKRPRSNDEGAGDFSVEDQIHDAAPTNKKAKVEERRSLFVRSLPPGVTNESLVDFFSEYFPVKHATVVVDQKTKESRGFGFVTLADADDASQAKVSLDKKLWDGRHIRIEIAEPRSRDATKGPRALPPGKPDKIQTLPTPKLIIRNLPWSIKTPDQLEKLFMSYGKVKFTDLPSTNGKLKGFGFVTLRGRKNSQRALEALNGKEIDGRPIAVDWAVDKKTWQNQQDPEEEEDAPAADEDADVDEEGGDEDAADDQSDAKSDAESMDADLENFMKNHMQNMEDEEDDDDDKAKDDASDDVDDGPKDSDAPKTKVRDNSTTIFVRNLPFTTTDESLKAFFGHFGYVHYARVVMDKATEKPAGTGFVCFANEADAKTCIKEAPRPQQTTAKSKNSILQDESADPTGRYTLDGRLLSVAQAVNKEQASHLADSALAKRREKDKRNLYLMAEGAISKGSALYDMLSPLEIRARESSAKQRRKQVQENPTLHMSLTRLALRNIPRDISSKDLKELARKAVVGFATDVKEGKRQPLSKEENARDTKDAKDKEHQRKLKKKGIVRQAKVVFESAQGSKVTEDSGAGRSRGYGFIEYISHRWALMGLRYLNGLQLQGEGGRKQRLIAEFAIENAQVMQRRRNLEKMSGQPAKAEREREGPVKMDRDAGKKGFAGRGDGKQGFAGRGDAKKGFAGRGDAKRDGRDKGRDKGRADKRGKPDHADAAAERRRTEPADPKEEMQQKLIGRKRIVRKKKANARGKA